MQKIAKSAAIAALLAAIVNTIVFFVATAISGDLVVLMPAEETLTVFQPFVLTAMLGIVGSLMVSFIAQRTANPRRTWVLSTIIAVTLYGLPPFLSAGITTAIWFNVMHAVAALFIIPAVAKQLPESK
jgi:hypothetical protein